MYLTRVFLDPSSGKVRYDATNPDGLHKTVMRLFPDDLGPEPRRACAILHRLDESGPGRLMLLIQSLLPPNAGALPEGYVLDLARSPDLVFSGISDNPSIRDVTDERRSISARDQFHFRLKANTTRKIGTKTDPEGKASNGRRVPLRGDEARLVWLKRHADAAGFTIRDVRIIEVAPRGRQVRMAGALFDGVLEVCDPEVFRRSVQAGVGPGKAFGFGLLSLSRVRKAFEKPSFQMDL